MSVDTRGYDGFLLGYIGRNLGWVAVPDQCRRAQLAVHVEYTGFSNHNDAHTPVPQDRRRYESLMTGEKPLSHTVRCALLDVGHICSRRMFYQAQLGRNDVGTRPRVNPVSDVFEKACITIARQNNRQAGVFTRNKVPS